MIYVIDAEGDSLTPTKLHCLSIWSEKHGLNTAINYDQMRGFFSKLSKEDVLVCHNIVRFDIPVFERILKIKINCRLVDSLALSWYLYPERRYHGLESWGEDFDIAKPTVTDWSDQPLDVYVHRCEEDVRINLRLWKNQFQKLLSIYKSETAAFKFLEYLTFKMYCARLAEDSGWKVDVSYCEKNLVKLMEEQEEKIKTLTALMPRVPVVQKKQKPKVLVKKDGSPSKIAMTWYELLASQRLPDNTEEVDIITEYNEPNPKAPQQIKDWLFSLGWIPQTFKEKKDKNGNTREIPQINLDFGKGICDSIKVLYDKEPELEVLDGLSILNHRIPMLRKFLTKRDSQDRVKASIQGLTNTLRFQHADPCVNMPKPEKRYAEAVRGSLISDPGCKLIGADMSSLEDRLKQHFIYPLDPEYVRKMMRDDFDPHLELAMMAKKLTQKEKEFYQRTDSLLDADKKNLSQEDRNEYKRIKTLRGIFKNGNYACQYGAYPPRLVKTCGIDLSEAKEVFDAYWKLNWAIKEVSSKQKILIVNGEMWLQNPTNGFFYSLRKKSDIFSTLIQGTASYVFDEWVRFILEEREQLTAQFHDEIVLCVLSENVQRAEDLCNRAIKKLNDKLKLNRELGIGVQIGTRYSDIH